MNPIYEQFRREQEEQKKYADAKKDTLKALDSLGKLSPAQRDQLFRELLGIRGYMHLLNEIQQYHR